MKEEDIRLEAYKAGYRQGAFDESIKAEYGQPRVELGEGEMSVEEIASNVQFSISTKLQQIDLDTEEGLMTFAERYEESRRAILSELTQTLKTERQKREKVVEQAKVHMDTWHKEQFEQELKALTQPSPK